MSEMELRDAILRHALQLQRLSAGEQAKADAMMRELIAELKQLLNANALSEAGKAEIKALIADAEKSISAKYARIGATLDSHALVVVVAERTVQAIEDAIPANVRAATAERLASLAKNVLIDGAPSSAWWDKQAEDTAFKFAAQVRQGVINGETNERIVQRIVGKGGEPGIMDVARRNARALVHSSVMTAANDARLATFRKNADLFAGVRWLSTLDSHTCRVCAALDGDSWDLEGKPLKGTTVEFMSPPAHFSCRCILTGVPKRTALEESFPGISDKLDAIGDRPSSAGSVPATTTFEDFLKRQPESFVEEVLGKRRAELFTEGKITLSDLISGTGRELTLEELGRGI